jgi:hypothetical protein
MRASLRVPGHPHSPGADAPCTPAFSIARLTKPDASTAVVNSFTNTAVAARSLA